MCQRNEVLPCVAVANTSFSHFQQWKMNVICYTHNINMVTIQQSLMLSNCYSIQSKINHSQPHAITAAQLKHLKHFHIIIKDTHSIFNRSLWSINMLTAVALELTTLVR